jgi:hypothetical protein
MPEAVRPHRPSRSSTLTHPARRSPHSLFLPCALAALVLLQAPAAALPADPQPTSAGPDQHAFPLTARIRGGPDHYVAGGASHTWFIDVKNTSAQTCHDIHPVLVLVDTRRALTAEQTRLEFFDGDRPHRVTLRRTDERELIGPFDDGFRGLTLAPGKTASVKVRLALTHGTPQDEVVVTAAIVRRHGNDGDWVGQSNDYRFRIESGAAPTMEAAPRSPGPAGEELADTGPRAPHGLGTTVGGLLLTAGGVLATGLPLLLYRWRRRARPQCTVPGGKQTDEP